MLLHGRVVGADAAEEQGRREERQAVDDERDRSAEDLDENARDRRPTDRGHGSAAVEERVRLDVLVAASDRREERHPGEVEDDRDRPDDERDDEQQLDAEEVGEVRRRDRKDGAGAGNVRDDHQAPPPVDAIEPGAGDDREQQVRQQPRGREQAHLRRRGIEDQHRDDRQRQVRHLVPEHADRLPDPEQPELALAKERRQGARQGVAARLGSGGHCAEAGEAGTPAGGWWWAILDSNQ